MVPIYYVTLLNDSYDNSQMTNRYSFHCIVLFQIWHDSGSGVKLHI